MNGSFVDTTIDANVCPDTPTVRGWSFPQFGGLRTPNNAPAVVGGSYTISMIVKFNPLIDGYTRLIDFSNSTLDEGVYAYDGEISLYPVGEFAPGSFVNNRFSFVTFTRDASTNIISVYVGTTPAGTYEDVGNIYVPSAQDVIFMMDNTTGPANIDEASAGIVTYIALIDTPATPGDIAGLQTQACTSVVAQTYPITVSASPAGGGVASCSPNPVLSGDDSVCTATANPGFAFVNWSGDCSGMTCTLSDVTSAKSVTANFVATADVQVSKTGPANVTGGNPIAYTLVFTNTGPSAANGAVWSDPVPAEISSVSASCGAVTGGAVCGSPTVAGNNVTGVITTFPSKSSVTVTISGVSPVQTAMLVNTATIEPPAGVPDSDTTNNSSTASTTTPVHLQSFEVD